MSPNTKKILLVDGNALIFRAYYATAYRGGNLLKTTTGIYTNAVFSFVNMLTSLIERNDYYDVKVAFDKGKHTFRHDQLVDYKAGRQKTPDELIQQFPIAREFLKAANIDYFEMDDYEADDLIGSMAQQIYHENQTYLIEILSSDKDLFQLINDRTFVLVPHSGTSDLEVFDTKALNEKWACTPTQVPDLKGIMGDPSDNLKGVAGIGEVGAKKLIHEYGSLENIYAHIDEIKGKNKERLINDKESAFLCRDLATIEKNIYIEGFQVRKLNLTINPLLDFLKKYEMKSIVRNLTTTADHINQELVIEYELIDQWSSDFNADNTSIFVESLDSNYHDGQIIGIGISNQKGNFFFNFFADSQLDLFSLTSEQKVNYDQEFDQFLQSNFAKETYDVKRTLVLLENMGYHPNYESFNYDMMSACYLLDPNITSTFSNHLAMISPDLSIDQDALFYGKGMKKTSEIDLNKKGDFIVKKAVYLQKVKPLVLEKLANNNQLTLLKEIDYRLTFVLLRMERHGVLIDQDQLKVQIKFAQKRIKEIELEIREILGDVIDASFNLSSPKQVGELLYDTLKLTNKKKRSTNREALEELLSEHAVVGHILEYRKWTKLESTYLSGFVKYIHDDSRVYTIFNQTLTSTGRLSSMEPNLQNIATREPEQRDVRKIFVVDEGYTFYSYDYSQIELRVLAQMAHEEHMLEIFAKNGDIHAESASRIFHVEQSQVDKEMRRVAKVFNFGIIYGLSAFGLSKDLRIGYKQAQELIDRYYEVFPAIKTFKDKTIAFANQEGYVETMSTRRRYLPELKSGVRFQKEFGERAAVNMPIQGTAADLLKIAMINIDQEFQESELTSFMSCQIHDEIIFSLKDEEIKQAKQIITKHMDEAFIKLKSIFCPKEVIEVKLITSESKGKNWAQLK